MFKFLAPEVLRVSWLKAKARYERWSEELQMVKHEMHWTVLWFQDKVRMWEQKWLKAEEPGQKAYAAKQRKIWESFQEKAEERFKSLL